MSAKNLDSHNRWRNKTVAFRVSPEEDAQIETAVRLTGLTKQDYIIRRLLNWDVVVQGNPRVYKALRDQLAAVLDKLKTKAAVPIPPVGAGGEQPVQKTTGLSIAEDLTENNPLEQTLEEKLQLMQRMSDPAYLHTVSMSELYKTVYQSRPPVVDGLLYSGTYLFAGAPKVGKSFLMASLLITSALASPCGATQYIKERFFIWRWKTTTAGCRDGCTGCLVWTVPTISALRFTPNSSVSVWRNS